MTRLRAQIHHAQRKRRGAALVFTGVTLIVLPLCASLAIDVGHICALTSEAQNTADAGALSGATLLQQRRSDELMERVKELVGANQKRQGFLSLNDQIIEVGKWDSRYLKFHVLPEDEWAEEAFAVRVRAVRNDAKLFFAAIAGHTETDVWREAVAVGTRPCRGIWGLEGIDVFGNFETDSFDSDEGPYNSATAGEEGSLCSGRAITISGSVAIHGDAMSGFGYPITINGSPMITGLTKSDISDIVVPDLGFGDISTNNNNDLVPLTAKGKTALNNSGAFDLNGDIELPAGNYYFQSFDVSASSTVTFMGKTTIFVEGDVSATGGRLINKSANPDDLTIIAMGKSVDFGGNYAFNGSIVAPNAEVRMKGTADLFGALIGRTLSLGGSGVIHVDESSPYLDLFSPPVVFLVH